jgi:hypothetical protein
MGLASTTPIQISAPVEADEYEVEGFTIMPLEPEPYARFLIRRYKRDGQGGRTLVDEHWVSRTGERVTDVFDNAFRTWVENKGFALAKIEGIVPTDAA